MSSEVRQFVIKDASKNSEVFSAQLLKLPIKRKLFKPKASHHNECEFWKLYDKTSTHEDGDQLKAVTGICLVLGVFSFIGLYSSILS